MRIGFAGKVAHAFLDSKLVPLVIAASLGLGALALLATPRRRSRRSASRWSTSWWPGPAPRAGPRSNRCMAPIERILWGVPGVEHVYSVSPAGHAVAQVTVRFKVNESNEDSLVKVFERQSAMGWTMPRDSMPPIVELHSIDRRPLPEPHPVGRRLVERPPAAPGRRAGPGALGGARVEPRAGHRRPAAAGARRTRHRAIGRLWTYARRRGRAARGRQPAWRRREP